MGLIQWFFNNEMFPALDPMINNPGSLNSVRMNFPELNRLLMIDPTQFDMENYYKFESPRQCAANVTK